MIFELMWVRSVPTRQLRAEHTELAYLRKIGFSVNSPGKITLSEVYGISQRYLSEDSCPDQGKCIRQLHFLEICTHRPHFKDKDIRQTQLAYLRGTGFVQDQKVTPLIVYSHIFWTKFE